MERQLQSIRSAVDTLSQLRYNSRNVFDIVDDISTRRISN